MQHACSAPSPRCTLTIRRIGGECRPVRGARALVPTDPPRAAVSLDRRAGFALPADYDGHAYRVYAEGEDTGGLYLSYGEAQVALYGAGYESVSIRRDEVSA